MPASDFAVASVCVEHCRRIVSLPQQENSGEHVDDVLGSFHDVTLIAMGQVAQRRN
jgi:hypothetical protein